MMVKTQDSPKADPFTCLPSSELSRLSTFMDLVRLERTTRKSTTGLALIAGSPLNLTVSRVHVLLINEEGLNQ